MIKTLIELGADPNLPTRAGRRRSSPRRCATTFPRSRCLLENGADVEKPGPQGFQPLGACDRRSKYEAAKALIEGGADVSAASGADGLTPLMLIAAQTSPAEGARFLPGSTRPTDIAKALIERGAEVNAQAKNGMTALMIAATHNSAPMIGLSHGCRRGSRRQEQAKA